MSTISAQMVKELRERSGAGMMECKKALVENAGDIEAAIDWLRKSGLAKADKKASRVAAEGRIVSARSEHDAVMVEVNCETDFVAKDASFLKFCDTVAALALETGAADIDALLAAAYPGGGTVAEAAKLLITSIGEKIDVRRVARVHATGAIGSYVHGGRIGVLVALDGPDEELAKGVAMHVAAMNPAYIQASDVPASVMDHEKDIALSQMSENEKHKPPAILEKIISGKVHKIITEITLLGQPYVIDTSMSVADALKKTGAHVEASVRFAVGEGIERPTEDFHAEVMKQAGLG